MVVGVTTDHDKYDPIDQIKYPPSVFIQMPHSEHGKCPSSFTSPCAAKANWVQRFKRTELGAIVGELEAAEVNALIVKLQAYGKSNP
jgi:hypothetical protein